MQSQFRENEICNLTLEQVVEHGSQIARQLDIVMSLKQSNEPVFLITHNSSLGYNLGYAYAIMELAKKEALLFRYGSGTGTDLSTLRSSRERISGGGKPSGPLAYEAFYDRVAGIVKSGGKTRRAAKMNSLRIDHPDIKEFIESKTKEEIIDAIFSLVKSNTEPAIKSWIQLEKMTKSSKKLPKDLILFNEAELLPINKSKPINIESFKIDVEDLWNVVGKIQNDKKDKSVVNKIIAIFKEDCLDLTCMTTSLDIIKIKVNQISGEEISYKKENLTNFVQIRKK
jgi:hypothetical protein